MASNYRKSFNFKNGVQVDTDNFIVDPVGKVGIGTTIPRQFLDVYGNDSGAVQVQGQVKVTGLTTVTDLYAGIGTVGLLSATNSEVSGITTTYGLQVNNSPTVYNLIGYAYTAWITDDGGVGLRTDSVVGIGTTTLSDFNLVIGSDPRVEGVDGIGFKDGDIRVTGIVTAPTFVGSLTGVAASATILETSRTFQITGDLQGAAISFNGSENVSIASTLSSSFNAETTGIITAATLSGVLTASSGYIGTATVNDLTQVTGGIATFLNIDGTYADFENLDVGVGTAKSLLVQDDDTTSELGIKNDTTSRISIGKSDFSGIENATISYQNGELEIGNYNVAGISIDLHKGSTGVDTGGFKIKYRNATKFNFGYDGSLAVNKEEAQSPYSLDVAGIASISGGMQVVGFLTITDGALNSYSLDPTNPPQVQGTNFNIESGISTLHTLNIIGTITASPDSTSGLLGLGTSKFNANSPVISIGTSSVTIGYADEDDNQNEKFLVTLSKSDLDVAGFGTFAGIAATDARIIVDNPPGVAPGVALAQTHLSGNIDNANYNRWARLGITTVAGDFQVGPVLLDDIDPISGLSTNRGRYDFGYLDNADEGLAKNIVYFNESVRIGIGTSTIDPYDTPGYNIAMKQSSMIIDNTSTVTATGKIQLRNPDFQSDLSLGGKISVDVDPLDPRGVLDDIRDNDPQNATFATANPGHPGLPTFDRGSNIDIDTTSTSMIFDGSLSIVPAPARQVSGYGNPTLEIDGTPTVVQGGLAPDFTGRATDPNTGDSNNSRLTMVGINTYLPRCLLDLGASSPSMNSYMILPTLDQASINIVQGLWKTANSGNQGHRNVAKITPTGVPAGAILYNSSIDKIQVRDTAESFRNLSPVVAFATVENGNLITTDGYNLGMTDSSNDANFTFSSNLPSANYTVIVSNQGTSTFTVPEANKATSGFKITFSSSANTKSYSVMVLQV